MSQDEALPGSDLLRGGESVELGNAAEWRGRSDAGNAIAQAAMLWQASRSLDDAGAYRATPALPRRPPGSYEAEQHRMSSHQAVRRSEWPSPGIVLRLDG